ncbi:TetR family transcriptional regulator [Cupriavidus necator]|uniref:TetR family transcriptional regulator n=1 Tax=Cupriavidus necator TaxID=106590 RepID=A0A1U9UQ67_CUPNE|nr:TetR/AcrR family transcriptional regulator [Cupriavidus necator]AQV94854.1 TetR family transcriptional regulator [Cupriavidus necator]
MTETTTVPIERRSPRKRRASAASEGASPETLRAQGLRTRNAIVRVARRLLLEGGPLEFSLRAVALRAGVSVSNLQYYFPTRPAVLRAVMEPEINAYLDALKRALNSGVSPREAHDAILMKAINDARDTKFVALWRHFFSFASTDPECANLLDEWYDTLTQELARVIRAINPKYGADESMQVAALLIAMADGLALQLGTKRRKHGYLQGLDQRYLAFANDVVLGKVPGPSKS